MEWNVEIEYGLLKIEAEIKTITAIVEHIRESNRMRMRVNGRDRVRAEK